MNRKDLCLFHTHEYQGSTICGSCDKQHGHRFQGVTGIAIPLPNNNHYHIFCGNSDYVCGHYHLISDQTGPAIEVSPGKHIHYAESFSSLSNYHLHDFFFVTAICNYCKD